MDHEKQLATECAREINRNCEGTAHVSDRGNGKYTVFVRSPLEGPAYRGWLYCIVARVCERHGWSMPREVVA